MRAREMRHFRHFLNVHTSIGMYAKSIVSHSFLYTKWKRIARWINKKCKQKYKKHVIVLQHLCIVCLLFFFFSTLPYPFCYLSTRWVEINISSFLNITHIDIQQLILHTHIHKCRVFIFVGWLQHISKEKRIISPENVWANELDPPVFPFY